MTPPRERNPADAPGRDPAAVAGGAARCLAAVFHRAAAYRTFCALAAGFLAQTGRRTVCSMLTGAGLSRIWPYDRAHYFFARARWPPDDPGLALARLAVGLLVPDGAPVLVAIDDTLFKRRGKKVRAASWFHDGSAAGPRPVGFGNNWVVAGIVVTLPFPARPACLPVLARLVVKNTTSSSRLYLARRMIESLAAALPGRTIHGAGDAAYSGKDLSGLDDRIAWTTRLRAGAALYDLPPGPTGRRGRPRLKGGRPPRPEDPRGPHRLHARQGDPLRRRHDRQAQARPHRRQISARSP